MEGEQGSLYVHVLACTYACICRYRWGRWTCQDSGLWRPEMKLWCLSLGTGLSLCIFWQTGSLPHGIQGSLTQLDCLLSIWYATVSVSPVLREQIHNPTVMGYGGAMLMLDSKQFTWWPTLSDPEKYLNLCAGPSKKGSFWEFQGRKKSKFK